MSLLFALILVSFEGTPEWELHTSQTYVYQILEDADGAILCATSGGIVRYDPDQGWLDPLLYPDGIPWPAVRQILPQDSLTWLATDGGGLAVGDGSGWQVFSSYEGLPGTGKVYAVHQAGGYIWAGTDGGLARGGPGGFTVVDSEITGGGFEGERVTGIASTGGTMYLATDRGVYELDLAGGIFDPASWTSYGAATLSMGIDDIYIHTPDSVFGYGSGGVALKQGGSWTRLLNYSASADSVVTGLLMSDEGLLASARVVIRYDGGSWSHYGSGYPEESYGSCLQLAAGRLWCGYGLRSPTAFDSGRGLGYLEDGQWKSLPVPGMPGASCYQLTWSGDRTYLGSHRAGLMAHYPEYGWRSFTNLTVDMPRSLRNYSAASIDQQGVWTGSYHWGLTWIGDGGTYDPADDTVITYVSDSLSGVPPEVVQVISPMLNNQVVMLASQNGALWVAQEAYWATPEERSGLLAVSGNPLEGDLQWAVRTETDGLAGKNIQRVFPCGDDSLWIAFSSDGGCQLLVHGGDPLDTSSDTWYPAPGQAYTTTWGLPSNQVFCFSRDNEGRVLLGTGNGIGRWNGSVFTGIGSIEGSVKAMEVDGLGTVWCMTEDAIYSVDATGTKDYTSSNSIYIPTNRMENEFSALDPLTGTVYFSSLMGLWSISPGEASHQGPSPIFYPQPFLPATDALRMAWYGDDGPVTARFFSLDGAYLGRVEAPGWEEWSWNGRLDGEALATGVYFVIVEGPEGSSTNKIALVR